MKKVFNEIWVAWWDCKNHCHNLIQRFTDHCKVLTLVTILKKVFCHCIRFCSNAYCTLSHRLWPPWSGPVGFLPFFSFAVQPTVNLFRSHTSLSSFWCKHLIKWIYPVNQTRAIKIKPNFTRSKFGSKFVLVKLRTKSNSELFVSFSHQSFSWFQSCCKQASSSTCVEVNDPTVAHRFKIVCYISLLSLSSSFCAFPIFNFLLFSGPFAVDTGFLQHLHTVALWYVAKVLRSSLPYSPASC